MINIIENSDELDIKDLFVIINAVRPNTFADKENNLEKLLCSKYYKTRDLTDEAKCAEHIYNFK